jgi:hypothetical protein
MNSPSVSPNCSLRSVMIAVWGMGRPSGCQARAALGAGGHGDGEHDGDGGEQRRGSPAGGDELEALALLRR